MDEEGAIDNIMEKIKRKRKDRKTKKGDMAAEEACNVDAMKAAESSQASENESISEAKGIENKKTKKSKGTEDSKTDMKNGSTKAELSVVCGENGGGPEMDSAERNGEGSSGLAMDNAERKRKRKEKKEKKEKSDDSTNVQEGDCVSGKESAEEVKEDKKKKKKKKQKVKRNDVKVGERDGEVIRMHSENCIVSVAEIRKETKKGKKKSKDDSFVGAKDASNETKCDDEVDLSSKKQENVPQNVEDNTRITEEDGNTKTNDARKKKKKHKKRENSKDDPAPAQHEYVDNDTNILPSPKEPQNSEADLTNKRKKKKTKFVENVSNDDQDNEAEYANKGKKRKSSLVVNGSNDSSPNKSNKKVRFSGQDEVFHLPSSSKSEKTDVEADNLVRGKRFTRDEDQIVKDAVFRYIEENDLGDEGVDMVLNCRKHPKLRGCWKEIASAIPYRPYLSVYFRARILFMRSETRKWTQEEYDMILDYQAKHGNQWKPLADELGKHTWHVKDAWRRIKFPNLNKGNWSQEEYQRLFDLVNTDLQLKVSEEKKSKHGMLRDNICWTAISDKLSTRAHASCCLKWYKQLTSSMVAEGVWADSDDYRLLTALYSLDATCVEDVAWDDLIDNRPGDVCRKRWNQMILHIGHNGNKSFAEQVEVLAERYCPHLLEARETWDNKPRVP